MPVAFFSRMLQSVRVTSRLQPFLLFAWLVILANLFSCGRPDTEFASPIYREKNFAALVGRYSTGRAEPTPWAGYWWPYTSNGIASGEGWFSQSAAEKYDGAHQPRSAAQKWEKSNHGSGVPKLEGWWGHCNGWSVASALFPEPRSTKTVKGVRFNVSDTKALLTEASMEAEADFFGERVEKADDHSSPKYQDPAPAQVFLAMTHYMGADKRAVLMDRHTGVQVWNHPIAGYRIEPPKPEDFLGLAPDSKNVYRINVTLTLWWVRDDVPPGITTPAFAFEENEAYQSRVLKFELWLDGPVEFGPGGELLKSGDVVVFRSGERIYGGEWRMGENPGDHAWPDYLWVPSAVSPSTGYSNPEIDIRWIQSHLF